MSCKVSRWLLVVTGTILLYLCLCTLKVPAQTPSTMDVRKQFFSAVRSGEVEKVRKMLDDHPELAGARDNNGLSAVINAMYYQKRAVADLLVASRLDLDIFEAAATGQTERVKLLLVRDRSLSHSYASDGFTPLHIAAFFGFPEVAEALIAGGAGVNLVSKNQLRAVPLQSATAGRKLGGARVLLAHGADPNVRGEGGYSPLHEAAGNGDLDLAKLLVDSRANINARGDDGKTPLTIALENKQEAMAEFLETRGARK